MLLLLHPPSSTLFPYTTLFRSCARSAPSNRSRSACSPDSSLGAPLSILPNGSMPMRSEEHTSELQSLTNLVCRLLLEKKKIKNKRFYYNNKFKKIHTINFTANN